MKVNRDAVFLIVQATLALMMGGVVCYMYVTARVVPETLVALVSMIIGYFFGERSGTNRANGYAEATEALSEAVRRHE